MRMASRSTVGAGGVSCARASLALLTHAAARFCRARADPNGFSLSAALCFLPHARGFTRSLFSST